MAQSPLPLSKGNLFPKELLPELINRVQGSSAIAALCRATPIPFDGLEQFVFNMESEISVVGESEKKPAAAMTITPITVTPIKVVYQSRVTEEFLRSSSENLRVDIMSSFIEGMSRKMGKGLDLMAFHKVNPATGAVTATIPSAFDTDVTNEIIALSNSSTLDQNVEDAIGLIQGGYYNPTGIAMSPDFRRGLANMTLQSGERVYPNLAWGAEQATMNGLQTQVNVTVSACPVTDDDVIKTDMAIIGDFQSAFRWGYSVNNEFEVIEFGDPDGSGYDLKAYNQVMLRSEAYIGFAILDPAAFAIIKSQASA